jgi:hypothetical protein
VGTIPVVPDIQQEITVLKKAGIVVAAAAAGLLAVSPLAFAGESHGKSWGHGESNSVEQNSEGLINVSDTNINAPLNFCNNDIPVNAGLLPIQGNVKDLSTAVTGALGLFGEAEADTEIDADSSRECVNGVSGDSVTQD